MQPGKTPKTLSDFQRDAVILFSLIEGIDQTNEKGATFDGACGAVAIVALEKASLLAKNIKELSDFQRGGGVVTPAEFAAPDTPIMCLFRKRCALRDLISSNDADFTNQVLDTLYCELEKINEAIMRLPVSSAADFAAKAIADSADGGVISDWVTGDFWIEARALTGSNF
jgi:hypothetical protein